MTLYKSGNAIVLLSMLCLAIGCGQESKPTDVIANSPSGSAGIDYLLQEWTRSYEEESAGSTLQVYRPSDSKEFPPSHFRMQYSFRSEGACEWLVLDPVDAHYKTDGTWQRQPKDERTIQIFRNGSDIIEPVSFRIIELQKDLLRIQPLRRGVNQDGAEPGRG